MNRPNDCQVAVSRPFSGKEGKSSVRLAALRTLAAVAGWLVGLPVSS